MLEGSKPGTENLALNGNHNPDILMLGLCLSSSSNSPPKEAKPKPPLRETLTAHTMPYHRIHPTASPDIGR